MVSIETVSALGRIIPSSPLWGASTMADAAAAYARWQASPDVYCAVLRIDGGSGPLPLPEPVATRDEIIASHRLVWQVDRFAKPAISLINAPAGGLSLGLAACGTHRVAGEDFAIAADAVRRGAVPGLGQTVALSRLPGQLGAFHALTGRPVDRVTAYRCGLATHLIGSAHFAEIEAALARADCVDPLLDGLHEAAAVVKPAAGLLAPYEGVIDLAFAGETLAEIIETLQGVDGTERGWARKIADEIGLLDPELAGVTLALLRRPAPADLRTRLTEDMRVCLHAAGAQRLSKERQGVRAIQWLQLPAPGEEPLPVPPAIPTAPAAAV